VPLLWTVYALVSFRNFQPLRPEDDAGCDAFYQAPSGYRRKALHESLSKDKKKRRGDDDGALQDFSFGGLEEEDFLT
jgi:hypothetical protein